MPQTLAALGGSAPAATAGQLWVAFETGGYMFSANLSSYLRTVVQKRCRFRQFCDLPEQSGSNAQGKGEQFAWNIYGDISNNYTTDNELDEETTMPTTRLEAAQGTCVVTEFGIAVPYSGKLDDLSEHPVKEIIRKALERHCARALDSRAHKQFDSTLVKVVPTSGTSATAITITTNGTPAAVNDAALTAAHVKEIALQMSEADVPTFKHGDYYALARPSTYRTVDSDLESIQKYTGEGFSRIVDGERGRYAGVRMVDQTNIAGGNFATNSKSDDAYFFGEDAVAECCVVPEEMRGKIPDDYGRGKGVAWYYLGNFAKTRQAAADERVYHWASQGE